MSAEIVKLDYPIRDGEGKEITELHIRRAKAKDIRKLRSTTDVEQSIELLAALTGLVPEDIDELDVADFTKASAVIEKMLKGKSALAK
ncbi:phage tail assembly protein [Gallibacterium anatis]|uniref:Phage tail protein E n=3 Tax=Gallibacterium anatis TaxID=750 RepID=F4HC84_GALAU|nr:phage tail assembly protein [Gallibacterium anatis]AEC17645.1 Phage tail protein E [Gallibacterium anatis UMN179]KGQ39859.1 phage tail protein [Gallibacterium anatis]KGQ59532.1 phage tail protein [Gallibacterium anatis 4895]MBP4133520.1 phage tail assembly protein [Gallibacterium anatis]OBW96707.1 phage tail protein [Gallibacterium anatis]